MAQAYKPQIVGALTGRGGGGAGALTCWAGLVRSKGFTGSRDPPAVYSMMIPLGRNGPVVGPTEVPSGRAVLGTPTPPPSRAPQDSHEPVSPPLPPPSSSAAATGFAARAFCHCVAPAPPRMPEGKARGRG